MLSGESVYRQPHLNLVKDFQEYCKYLVMTKPGIFMYILEYNSMNVSNLEKIWHSVFLEIFDSPRNVFTSNFAVT